MRIPFFFLLFCICLVFSCKTDNNNLQEIDKEDLIGEWEIYHAIRNGKATKSLEKGNFVFQTDNLVSSNLFSASNSLNFTYNEGIIGIEGDPNMDHLKIKRLQNDTLVMTTKLKVFELEFYLTKK